MKPFRRARIALPKQKVSRKVVSKDDIASYELTNEDWKHIFSASSWTAVQRTILECFQHHANTPISFIEIKIELKLPLFLDPQLSIINKKLKNIGYALFCSKVGATRHYQVVRLKQNVTSFPSTRPRAF